MRLLRRNPQERRSAFEPEERPSQRQGAVQPGGFDLLRFSPVRRLFASPTYPLAFQILSLAVLLLVFIFAWIGPPMGENNFAVVVTWKLWWLTLPLSFVFFGRLWCGVCPIGAVAASAQRIPFPGRRDPGQVLVRYGTWIMGALFLALFWLGTLWHICCWPTATAAVLLLLVLGAGVMGFLFRGRAWCRFVCPLGVLSGLYSMTAVVALRSQKGVCLGNCTLSKKQTLQGEMERCPLYELPMAMDTNRHCNLCGECVKGCHLGSMQLLVRPPGSELWQLKRPLLAEAVFAVILTGVALVEASQTTQLLPAYMQWAMDRSWIASYDLVFSLSLLLVFATAVASYVVACFLSAGGKWEGLTSNVARFGYGYIPLALAGYLAVVLFRLTQEGPRAIQVAINQLILWAPVFELPPPQRGAFYSIDLTTKALQYGLLWLGTLGSLYVIWRIAQRWGEGNPMKLALPQMTLVILLAIVLALTFALPAGIILH